MLSADWRNKVLLPGALTVHHAPILERGGKTNRCESCHAAGNQTFIQWVRHAVDDELAEPSQTQLCLDCHAKQIPKEWATAAHNIAPEELQLLSGNDTVTSRRVDHLQSLTCATCHREHHGAEYDLSWMSDKACQACHKEQYHSFAEGHPEFDSWPAERRTRIAFDHAAHEAKHFPKEKKEFGCAVCHQQSVDGDFQRTLDYESACSQCHDRDMRASWEKGIDLFSLPMLDLAAFEDAGHDVGQWPEEASDEFDGSLPPITKLLLLADPKGKAGLETLSVGFDFFDIDPDDAAQMQAAADVVWATKKLLSEVTEGGHAAIRDRVSTVLGRKISQYELAGLVAHLAPEGLAIVSERWLTQLSEETRTREGETKVAEETATEGDEELGQAALQELVSGGGWFHDEVTLSIRYQPSGHDDRWLAAWIDVLAEASGGPHGEAAELLLRQIMKPTAAGQCGSCHSMDRTANNQLVVQWLSKQASGLSTEFTKFSHRPHMVQANLRDCKACHQIRPEAKVMASYTEYSALVFEEGFKPITKQSCAECHTTQAAVDSCLQCHRYHVGNRTTDRGPHVSAQSIP